jgi:N-acetyl-alpha-D-muramate 1-phosphate uridylyltransferase
MNAMILAAGLGQRMRPLTDQLPKPLLSVGGKPLLQYHLEALKRAGICEVVVNLAYLGDKIQHFVGDGSRFGMKVIYSQEPEPLETAGGLLNALPLLGDEPFVLVNGDVWSDYPLEKLTQVTLKPTQKAHLVLVANPEFHPHGDFTPNAQGVLVNDPSLLKYTFAGISVMHPDLIRLYPHQRQKFPLGEVLRYEIPKGTVTAEIYTGQWSDVGTPERLFLLDMQIKSRLAETGS